MTARHRKLAYTTGKKVDIVHVTVHALQLQSLLSRHVAVELLEIVDLFVKTLAHHMNVPWNAVLSSPSDVERDQITTEAVLSPSVQVVANVVGNKWVCSGRVTGRHPSQNVIQLTVFQNVRIKVVVLQGKFFVC